MACWESPSLPSDRANAGQSTHADPDTPTEWPRLAERDGDGDRERPHHTASIREAPDREREGWREGTELGERPVATGLED